ncbi:SHOCT domain-containing protein [Haloterrigena longa]|uniref:SHOCT domain-containing protein n=2 Tax=Natrinema longum TaxID=370324 RepID=A0A8A2UK05_9EURY|nr:SHOCT domain-containing protein [Natrinema longum]QSW86998.1 SHOCT domain-containing protein [Natrinema longum]
MKHRLVIRTDDTTYHCWIDSSYEESALAAATDALRRYRDRARSPGDSIDARAESPASRSPMSSDGGENGDSGGDAAPSAAGGTDSADDPLETIERLAELNEQGVISDEEFEEKKRDLLDQL